MKNFKLSIIIPTWNRKEKLIKLLNIIILNLKKNQIIFEIIICDSLSKDGTEFAVKSIFKNNSNIYFKNIKENNISKKRNIGIKVSKYSNILLLDDDCVPNKKFFKVVKKYLNRSKNNEIYCGQYLTNQKLISKSNYYKFRDLKNLKTNKLAQINYNNIITGCCFFKNNNSRNFIYFNEKIKGYGLEDIEWAYNLKIKNFGLFLTEAKVDHQETSQNIGAYILKWYMLSRDAMPSLLKNKKNQMKGKIFTFEEVFAYSIFKSFLKIMNYFLLIPISILLKFFLIITDKNKYLFSKKLFNLLLFFYYLRGACDRNKKSIKKTHWYNLGYK